MPFKLEFAHLENVKLIFAKCVKCKRAYYWSQLPEECPWPGCSGRFEEIGSPKNMERA
jgi:hypothetical protein